MSLSSPSLANIEIATAHQPSFYEKLNTRWHERALQVFMVIVLGPLGRASCSGLSNLRNGLAAAESQRHSWIVVSLADSSRRLCTTGTRS